MTIKQLNLLSAAMVTARPIFEYVICPNLKQTIDSHALNKFCDIITTVATVAPISIGTGSIAVATYQIREGFLLANYPILRDKLLPTSLALYAAQGLIKGQYVPTTAFIFGSARAAMVILSISAIGANVGAATAIEKFAIAVSTTSCLNSLFSISSEAMNDGLDYADITKASDYAIGFAVSRPLNQIAMYSDNKLISSSLFFVSPIARGVALGLIGQGSILVPGSNYGVTDNVIDGAAIAAGAFVADNILGPTITSALLATAIIAYKNQDIIQDMVGIGSESNVTDNEL